jgi:hypothetical protein
MPGRGRPKPVGVRAEGGLAAACVPRLVSGVPGSCREDLPAGKTKPPCDIEETAGLCDSSKVVERFSVSGADR